MAKQDGAAVKKETPAAAATPAGAAAHAPSAPKAPTGKKHHEPAPGMCTGLGCKAKSARFNFCNEHYEQFKFGLINKFGEQVPDYEKKWEHYQAYVAKMNSFRKAA